MGFVNEVISVKDKAIIDFHRLFAGHPSFQPKDWCIDRERNAAFIRVPRRGRYEQDMPERFALVMSGALIWVELFLASKRTDRKEVTWTLADLSIPEGVNFSREEVLGLVREALNVYTVNWLKSRLFPQERIEVQFRF